MTKKDVPEVYTVMFLKWIADKFEIGDNVTIIQKQPSSKGKSILMVTIMRHTCGRPPGAARKKEKGMQG